MSSLNNKLQQTTPYNNIANAYPNSTRQKLGLTGLIPSAVETQKVQKKRVLTYFNSLSTNLDKYMLLGVIRNTNLTLFYSLLIDNFTLIAPIIYTPTVGEACQKYSLIQPFLGPIGNPDGLFVSIDDIDNNLNQIFNNYVAVLPEPLENPTICVVTDGSRILGLGDLGVNGMGIPVGKLQLYSGAAGIDPKLTMPITLDLGTNNDTYLKDEVYLGVRKKRPADEVFYKKMDLFMNALTNRFPDMLIQFEDFSSEHAFGLLERYRNKYFCFNDDIQGTGAVILAGYINAIKISKTPLKDQKIVFFGAGSAGVGVAKQIMQYFIKEGQLDEKEAKKKFWLIDSKGLITKDRKGELEEHKKYFARDDNLGVQYDSLEKVIDNVYPSALIGLSSQHNAFTPQIIRKMANINKRPIIFPLSNPETKAETDFETALKNTNYTVLFASGTAFPSYKDIKSGKTYYPGQGNNAYIFPGLGYGCILAKPLSINDDILYSSSIGLANSISKEELLDKELLYPDISRIREISAIVAGAVITKCVDLKLTNNQQLIKEVKASKNGALEYAKKRQWHPSYY